MTDSKFNSYINKLADEEFEYGKSDCFTFTAKLVKKHHGTNFLPFHRYDDEEEAEQYMQKYGGIVALTTGQLGYSVDPMRCRFGDVVIAEFKTGLCLGFVLDNEAIFKTKTRAVKLPLKKCKFGWRL